MKARACFWIEIPVPGKWQVKKQENVGEEIEEDPLGAFFYFLSHIFLFLFPSSFEIRIRRHKDQQRQLSAAGVLHAVRRSCRGQRDLVFTQFLRFISDYKRTTPCQHVINFVLVLMG